ncbi:MAG: hypothetical protein ACE5GX_15515 [Thermoanaerobaculia bacterium]
MNSLFGGRGSRFDFTASLRKAGPPIHNAAGGEVEGLRALVVDADPRKQAVTARTLKQWGLETWTAGDAQGAVASVAEAQSRGQHFDLILISARSTKPDAFATVQSLVPDRASDRPN